MHALGGARKALGQRDRNEAAKQIWWQAIITKASIAPRCQRIIEPIKDDLV